MRNQYVGRQPQRRQAQWWGTTSMRTAPVTRSAWLGLGFPLSAKGQLKSVTFVGSTEPTTGTFFIGMINCCDMNNDKRIPVGGVSNYGISHLITDSTPTAKLLAAPYYFDVLAAQYAKYIVKKLAFKMEMLNADTTAVNGDFTIAWKLIKSHDDVNDLVRNSASVELIKAQPGLHMKRLNPSIANRGGAASAGTISGSVDVVKAVPKRVYFAEASEITVGEKSFNASINILDTDASVGPRIVFWVWGTFDHASIQANTFHCSLEVTYDYIAYDRIIPAVTTAP